MSKEKDTIDLAKFILSIFLVIAHFGNEWGKGIPSYINLALSFYIVVVPFFFACSGYFLWKGVKKTDDATRVYKKYIFRILKLYLAWSLVYLVFKVIAWSCNGVAISEILKYVHHSIVYSSYSTIWFLPACAVGGVLIWILTKKFSIKTVSIIAAILYMIGCLGYSYAFLWSRIGLGWMDNVIDVYKSIFVTTRNGLFNGFPWMWLGVLLAEKETNRKIEKTSKCIALSLVSIVLVVIEAFSIKRLGAVDVNTTFLMIPFIWYFIQLLLSIDIKVPHSKWLRKMSTQVFCSQRIFLTAIPTIFPNFMVFMCNNSLVGLMYVLGCTVLLSALILWGSKRSAILRYLT